MRLESSSQKHDNLKRRVRVVGARQQTAVRRRRTRHTKVSGLSGVVDLRSFFLGNWETREQPGLAGIVCNRLAKLDPAKFEACANPCKGVEGGDTWEARMSFIDAFKDEL